MPWNRKLRIPSHINTDSLEFQVQAETDPIGLFQGHELVGEHSLLEKQ